MDPGRRKSCTCDRWKKPGALQARYPQLARKSNMTISGKSNPENPWRVRKQPEWVVYCVSDLMQVWKSRNSPSISHLWHHDPVWEAPTLLPWTTLFRSSEGTHTVFSIGIPQMRNKLFFIQPGPWQKSWRYVINLQMETIFHCHPRNDQPFPSGSLEELPRYPWKGPHSRFTELV